MNNELTNNYIGISSVGSGIDNRTNHIVALSGGVATKIR